MEGQQLISMPDWGDKVILIGEDEAVNFKLLEMILMKTKIKLLHGGNGLEVINLFKKNPDVSLILMDIKMPDMDGLEAMKEIRKFNTDIPVIAQTAYSLDDEKIRYMESGFNGYITKPINRVQLLSVLQSFL